MATQRAFDAKQTLAMGGSAEDDDGDDPFSGRLTKRPKLEDKEKKREGPAAPGDKGKKREVAVDKGKKYEDAALGDKGKKRDDEGEDWLQESKERHPFIGAKGIEAYGVTKKVRAPPQPQKGTTPTCLLLFFFFSSSGIGREAATLEE